MSPRDRLWMERAKRRYGRLIDVGARWSNEGRWSGSEWVGGKRRWLGLALLHVGVELGKLDRKVFLALGR